MSTLEPEKLQRWIIEQLEITNPPSEAKLAKICKGTLANLWQQLIENYASTTTQRGFCNKFLSQEAKWDKTDKYEEEKEQTSNDEEDLEEWKDAIDKYKQKLSHLEKQIYDIEQQIQLLYCRKTLAQSTCDRFSAWEEETAKKLDQIDKQVSQYNMIETIGESGTEMVNIEKGFRPCSNLCPVTNKVFDFVKQCMESCSEDEFLTLLEQHIAYPDMVQSLKQYLYYSSGENNLHFCCEEYQSIVDNQKFLLWNLQALFRDLSIKYTKYQNQLEAVSQEKDYYNENYLDKNLVEALIRGEEATEQMLRKMQENLESNSCKWISDEDLEASFSKIREISTQIESDRLALKALDDEMQTIYNELEQTVNVESSHRMLEELCLLSRKAEDSIKNIKRMHQERIQSISSLEEFRVPVITNHFVMAERAITFDDSDTDLKDCNAMVQLLSVDDRQKWHHCRDLQNYEKSVIGHNLLNSVIESQVERDLAISSLKARKFEHEVLNELTSKEYHLMRMQQQVKELQQYWAEEISCSMEHASSLLNKVTQLLPYVRNLLDVWKFQPGLFVNLS